DQRVLALVRRTGEKRLLDLPSAPYGNPKFSPDGRYIAVHIWDRPSSHIWIHDLNARTAIRRLTFEGRNWNPHWTPDGKRLLFNSDRASGGFAVFWQAADGSTAAESLTKPGGDPRPQSVSPDGRTLLFGTTGGAGIYEIWFGTAGTGGMN